MYISNMQKKALGVPPTTKNSFVISRNESAY